MEPTANAGGVIIDANSHDSSSCNASHWDATNTATKKNCTTQENDRQEGQRQEGCNPYNWPGKTQTLLTEVDHTPHIWHQDGGECDSNWTKQGSDCGVDGTIVDQELWLQCGDVE